MAQTILWLIVGFIVFEFVLSKVLSYLNLQTWNKPLPEEVKDLYDAKKYEEAKEYAQVNYRFGTISSTFSLIVSIAFLVLGGFAWVDGLARGFTDSPILQALIFFGIIGAGSSIIGLPFGIYHTFVIEQRFGFNKTTVATFVADKVKSTLLAIVIGGGLLALLTWLFLLLGDKFWIAAWIVVTAFTLFFAMFYATLFAPIFNKLTPLEEGELRTAIELYAQKVSFPLTNIFVVDGSKRSAKANAYFSGLGSQKSIVLYDTLIKDLTTEEITSVLAHEVGHYKKKHILQSMVLSVVQIGVMLFIFGLLAGSPVMAEVLGAKENSFHLSLVAFSMVFAPISLVTGVLMHIFSRKNEYEADAYARDTYAMEPLITSLKKMSVNHLNNLQPHPAYVFFNYSHPTLLQRINAMRNFRIVAP